jgi:eukaryotic-like serine/threonine-protein kinase
LSSLVAGSTLCDGRYRLDGPIGRGGMAIVWRARDLQLERDVALKVISDVLASDPSFVARFEREARLAAALNHPNLVKVFDFSVDDGRPFLVMELVSGGTLADARRRSLDADSLARELLDAVAHIHGAGILHRDIKPANVLLGADGSPRLTDFGIARGDETTGLTQPGQVLGTLRYIAPEVAEGKPATRQSDLYSLGVLLGEIHGERSPQLDRLVARMTDPNPARRPASATEALAELNPTQVVNESAKQHEGLSPISKRLRSVEAPTRDLASEAGFGRGLSPISKRLRSGPAPSRNQAVAAAAVLLAVLVLVIVAASGGGGGSKTSTSAAPKLAPAGAPAAQQFDALERAVRGLPTR